MKQLVMTWHSGFKRPCSCPRQIGWVSKLQLSKQQSNSLQKMIQHLWLFIKEASVCFKRIACRIVTASEIFLSDSCIQKNFISLRRNWKSAVLSPLAPFKTLELHKHRVVWQGSGKGEQERNYDAAFLLRFPVWPCWTNIKTFVLSHDQAFNKNWFFSGINWLYKHTSKFVWSWLSFSLSDFTLADRSESGKRSPKK